MAKRKYKIILSRRADRMLLGHTQFLAKVSPAAARRFITGYKKTEARIASNPFQFPIADGVDAPGISPGTHRRGLFAERYKVLFVVEENDVFIEAIIDCRQENDKLFGGIGK